MLEIVLKDQQGTRAVMTGEVAWEYSEKTMQYTLVNLKTGARLLLDGLLVDELHYEMKEPYWVSGPELPGVIMPEVSKATITATMAELPVEALLKLFTTSMHLPQKYDVGGFLPTAMGFGPTSNERLVGQLARLIPGMNLRVCHPGDQCKGGKWGVTTVRDLVIHLNDRHEWTYQQIAEWLDTLDVDLSVKEPTEETQEGLTDLGSEQGLTDLDPEWEDLGSEQGLTDLGPEWQDLGYIKEDALDAAVGAIHSFQGGTAECTLSPVIDGINEQILKLLADADIPAHPGTTDQKED